MTALPASLHYLMMTDDTLTLAIFYLWSFRRAAIEGTIIGLDLVADGSQNFQFAAKEESSHHQRSLVVTRDSCTFIGHSNTTGTIPTMASPRKRKEREPPLVCKCKEGRCVECRRCPRKSCKLNRCECIGGPTRLRVPNHSKRKRSDFLSRSTDKKVCAQPPAVGEPSCQNTFLTEALSSSVSEAPLVMGPLGQVSRQMSLKYAEDVVEALQLPKRQIMSRFQRRKIAKEGIESLQSTFERQCLSRTVQTFRDGVQKLAELLLPEDPGYLCDELLHSKHVEAELLKTVVTKAPRKSIQSRTARAVLAAALPRGKTDDIMSKHSRQVALKDWELLKDGMTLDVSKSTDVAFRKQKPVALSDSSSMAEEVEDLPDVVNGHRRNDTS